MWNIKEFTGVLQYQGQPVGSAFVVSNQKRYIVTCKHILDEIVQLQRAQSIEEVLNNIHLDEACLTFHLGGTSIGVALAYVSSHPIYDVALLQYPQNTITVPSTPPLLDIPPIGSDVLIGGYAVIPDDKYATQWFSTVGKVAGDFDRQSLQGGHTEYLIHIQSQTVVRGMSGAPIAIQGLGIIGIQSERYYPPDEDNALEAARWAVPIKAATALAPEDLKLTNFPTISENKKDTLEVVISRHINSLSRTLDSELEKNIALTGNTNTSFLRLNPEFELLTIREQPQNISLQRETINDIVEYVLNRPFLRIAIVGPSGSGKSTSLNLIMMRYCLRYEKNKLSNIPVVVNLGTYQKSDTTGLEDFIRQQLLDASPLSLSEHLKRYILFIDAFDELPIIAQIDLIAFLDQFTNCSFVLGCKSSHEGQVRKIDKIRLIEILPLDELKIRSYVQSHLNLNEADELFWELMGDELRGLYQQWEQSGAPPDAFWRVESETPRNFSWYCDQRRRQLLITPPLLLEMARNPYMLRMMIVIYMNHLLLSVTRGQLIRDFVRVLIRHGQIKYKTDHYILDEVESALSSLAYKMINEELLAINEPLALQTISGDQSKLASYSLKVAVRGGLIDQHGELFQFRHSMLRSYLATIELNKRISSGNPLTAYIPSSTWWEYNRWTEAFTFLPALYGSSNILVKWLTDIQPELAAQCLSEDKNNQSFSETREHLRKSIYERLERDHITNPIERAALGRALGVVGDKRRGVGVSKAHSLPDIEWLLIPSQRISIRRGEQTRAIDIKAFSISRYPITNEQYNLFLHSKEYKNLTYWTKRGRELREMYKWYFPKNYGYPFNLANHPVVGISWHESFAFCHWLTTRTEALTALPSIWQWMVAAQSSEGISGFPWGLTFDQSNCNARESRIGTTTAVGLFPEGQSCYKVQDCGGNVWEYCLPDLDTLRKSFSLSQLFPERYIQRVLNSSTEFPVKGGSFTHFQRCLYIEHDIYAKDIDREWDIGFRAVKEV